MAPKLSIVIPCFNERATIAQLLDKVREADIGDVQKEIIVIDDCSTDGTREILEKLCKDDILIFNEKNLGKGASLRKGFQECTGDIIIVQDADLEYDPGDYKKLIEPILDGRFDVVYGSRILNKSNKRHSHMSFYVGGRFLSFLTNLLYGSKITDEPTCYKVFRRETLMSIPLTCDHFEFCPEVTAKILKRGIPIHEEPISYFPRTISEGKKINWKDGLEAIWTLLKYRFIN